jgi:hypothetical protein
VREIAKAEADAGMDEMSQKFKADGAEIYHAIDAAE